MCNFVNVEFFSVYIFIPLYHNSLFMSAVFPFFRIEFTSLCLRRFLNILTGLKAGKRPRLPWIDSNLSYVMSVELFRYITDDKQQVIYDKFHYRKDSIEKEIEKLFTGCVIYCSGYYEAVKFWRIEAYCSHLDCRNYRLIAQYETPNLFKVSFDRPHPKHQISICRQIRLYERDKAKDALEQVMPNTFRIKLLNDADKQLIESGNFEEVASIDVFQKIRSEALSR